MGALTVLHMLARRLLFIVLSTLPFLAGTAAHADQSGLDIAVRGDDPLKPVVVLTNKGGSPCQVVTSALGTVAITRAEQAGSVVEPSPMDVAIEDGPHWADRWHILAPGASTEIPLNVVEIKQGLALESVSWSGGAGFGSLYVLQPGQPVKLEVTYSVPVAPEGEPPACPPAISGMAAGPGEEAAAEKRVNLWLYGAIAGAFVVIGLVVILLVIGRRRRKATATVVLLLAALGAFGWPASQARADFSVDPGLQGAFDDCMELLRQPGNDPAGILPALDAPDMNVQVVDANGDDTHAGILDDRNAIIFWDPNDRHAYHGSGGNADPCTSLYHEMHHVWQGNQHTYSLDPCATSDPGGRTLPKTEVLATHAQNALRRRLGMPARSHYGDIPLPEGCDPPRPQQERCSDSNCGDSNGDPHLLTFDNKRYDFQAAGEFVLARSTEPGGGYEVQVRQEPAGKSRVVAVNTAVAMSVGPDRVEVRATTRGLVLVVGGQVKPLQGVKLTGGGQVKANGPGVVVSWKDGPRAFVRPIGPWGLHIALEPVAAQSGKVEGLLGDFDGDSTNDIRPRGGDPITEPTFDALYPAFADSWRVDAATSLFTYEPGTGPETFVDSGFPEAAVDIDQLPNRVAAEALCRSRGVTVREVLDACIIDVALTGQVDFAIAAASGQVVGGGSEDFGGTHWNVTIDQPGQAAKLDFPGSKGQKVFVDIPVTTLPNQCGGVALLAPDGKRLTTGCFINGKGYVDGTVLPGDGTYSITIEPAGDATGLARVRLIPVTDQQETITADGPEVVAVVDRPGRVSRFTFTGAKDQKVFLDIPSATLPDQCGGFDLRGPDGRQIATGCSINGRGYIDAAVLPAAGTYTIVVDPADRRTGQARLRLINAIDQNHEIVVNGPAVDLRLRQPGAVGRFTFVATAGQRVVAEISSATLPNQCGVVALRGPDGKIVGGGGCVINGKGELTEVVPEPGIYTLVIDPASRATGAAVVRLRT